MYRTRTRYRHRFTDFTDVLIPVYDWGFRVLGRRYVSAEFGPRARNVVERRLAKGDYTLYPCHLAGAGLAVQREELHPFVLGLQIYYRVAVKGAGASFDIIREDAGDRRYRVESVGGGKR